MANTSIEWTDKVWNPIAGCSKVSAGCKNCYAEVMSKRLVAMGVKKYQGTINDKGNWSGKINIDYKSIYAPLKWKKPCKVFVNSMSDLFHPEVDFPTIAAIFSVMEKAHQHTFQILTKRPERAVEYFKSDLAFKNLPNVWFGVSAENQETADERIPYLTQIPAVIKWVSAEPLLGPIDFSALIMYPTGFPVGKNPKTGKEIYSAEERVIDWVVVGGESGQGARPMQSQWVRDIRDCCEQENTAFNFKQWGEWHPWEQIQNTDRGPGKLPLLKDCKYFKIGKKRSGRQLDGQVYDNFPPTNAGGN